MVVVMFCTTSNYVFKDGFYDGINLDMSNKNLKFNKH